MTFPTPASGITSSQVWGTAVRTVAAPVGRVRGELVRLLGQQGFTLSIDQLTLLEASRGSAFAGAGKSARKIPVQVKVRLTGSEGDGPPTCTVWLDVRDGWKLPMGRPLSVYSEIIGDLLAGADDVLRRIDPAAAFPPAQRSVHSPIGASSAAGSDDSGGAVARMTQAANRYLDNDPKDAPKGWRDRGKINIATPKGVAVLTNDTVYGLVTAGTLVASRPGPMPPPLVAQVERVVAVVEKALEAGSTPQDTWLRMGPGAIPVIEFLVQQAQIREAVPLRTLQVCVTCRLAKVVNPDYAKLRSRTTKLRTLQSSLGALVTTQGISPFVLIGKLSQLNQLDPEFVCPRCQGLHAENTIITFCLKCGDQRDESALRTCPKCNFDFRTLANTASLWKPPAEVPGAVDAGSPPVLAPSGFAPGTPPSMSPPPAASGHPPTHTPTPFPTSFPATPADEPTGGGNVPVHTPTPFPDAPAAEPVTTEVPVTHTPTPFPSFGVGSAERSGGAPTHTPTPFPETYRTSVPDSRAPGPFGSAPAATPFPQIPGQAATAPASFPPLADGGLGPSAAGSGSVSASAPQLLPEAMPGTSGGFGLPAAAVSSAAAPAQHLHLLPAWYPDPTGRHQFRWWDGGTWASFVLDYGRSSVDPLG